MGDRAVDSTASGPLFQQRPYPAPGAVIRKREEVVAQHVKRLREDDGIGPSFHGDI
jgi:GMP synthase PP-ATPase subunit